MKMYKDKMIFFGIVLFAIILVAAPLIYGYMYPDILLVLPQDRADFYNLLTSDNTSFYSERTIESKFNIGKIREELINKYPNEREFLYYLLKFGSSNNENVLRQFSFFYVSIDKYPLINAYYKIVALHSLNKEVDIPKIKEFIYRVYAVENHKRQHGGHESIEEYFKEVMFISCKDIDKA